jgi:hypothetical protein
MIFKSKKVLSGTLVNPAMRTGAQARNIVKWIKQAPPVLRLRSLFVRQKLWLLLLGTHGNCPFPPFRQQACAFKVEEL